MRPSVAGHTRLSVHELLAHAGNISCAETHHLALSAIRSVASRRISLIDSVSYQSLRLE